MSLRDNMKQYALDLMNDKKTDLLSRLVKACLSIVSYAYGFLVKCHDFLYNAGVLKSAKPEKSVLSVGNITLGGTGKTPFVVMLSEMLTAKNENTAVLIRGYGQDEWKMLEDKLSPRGIGIFVGRDRLKSAFRAAENNAKFIILDDGFQHRRLKRDLDIVLLDAANPFGNRRIFPRGILREPPESLKRADIIVFTKIDKGKTNIAALEKELKKMFPGKTILKTVHSVKGIRNLRKGKQLDAGFLNKKEICLVSAICDPDYFRYTVLQTGAGVGLEFIFPDHHLYKRKDFEDIFKECERKGIDIVLVTEKDAVKLKDLRFSENNISVLALAIEMEIVEGKEELDARIRMLCSHKDI